MNSTQWIRLWDVFFIGPFLIYVGFKYEMPKPAKWTLIAIGVGTIIYNGVRFLKFKTP